MGFSYPTLHLAKNMPNNPSDLKASGLKATLPRLKILEIFQNSSVRHLSAEDVYKILLTENMDVGLATVYRVLTQFEQAGLLRNTDECTAGVKQIDEEENKYHAQQTHIQRAVDIHLQQCRCQGWWAGKHAGKFLVPEQYRQHRDCQDTDDHAAADAALFKCEYQQEASNRQPQRVVVYIAERDEGCRMANDDVGILERNQCEEKADTGGDRKFQ